MNIIKILKNASYLFLGNISIRMINAFANILLARFIGPSEFGVFSIAIALSSVTGYFTDAGLSNTFMREATKKGNRIEELISSFLRLRILFSLISLVFSYFFINSFYYDDYLISIISWIVYPTIIGMTFQGVTISYFQAKEKMGYSTIVNIIQGITSSTVLFLGMYFNWTLLFISKLYGATFIITGIVSILFLLKYCTIHKGWNKNILNQLHLFTISGLIIMTLPQLGPIITGKVSTLNVVGLFSTAYKIPSVLYQIPGVVANAFYPQLFKTGNNLNLHTHRELSKIELKIMSFIGIVIAIPFIVSPNFWVISLLGEEWSESSSALAILSFMVILQSINYPLADNLTTSNQQNKRTFVMFIGFLVSILSYIILGKNFGLIGASIAAIITEVTLLFGYTFFVRSGLSLLFNSIKYNIASFIAILLIYKILPENIPLVSIFIVCVLYVIFVIVLDKEVYRSIIKYFNEKK